MVTKSRFHLYSHSCVAYLVGILKEKTRAVYDFWSLGCLTFASCGTLAGVTEIWTITCIVYERHRTICTPLTKAGRLSNYQINLMICAIWSMGFLIAVLPLMNINSYVLEVRFEFSNCKISEQRD